MADIFLSLEGVRLTFGGAPLFDGVDMQVSAGARLAVVGRNGSGKSTLMKIAAGLIEADAGRRFADPKRTVAYLPQTPDFGPHETVGAYISAGAGPTSSPAAAAKLMDALALAPEMKTTRLSGGEARRAALARLFAAAPDVMLLDEPTNHLDLAVE